MFAFEVEDIIPAGYAPYTDKMISEQIKNEVIRNKKGDKLIADYKGKANDIAGYASAMSVAVDTTTSNFAQPFIAVIGYEPTLAGSIAGATAGKVSGPVKGNNAVFVYQVSNVDAEGPKLSDEQASNRFAQTMGSMVVERNLVNILRQNSKVSNDLIKFF